MEVFLHEHCAPTRRKSETESGSALIGDPSFQGPRLGGERPLFLQLCGNEKQRSWSVLCLGSWGDDIFAPNSFLAKLSALCITLSVLYTKRNESHIFNHLAIQVLVTCFASSTNPMSSSSCTVPLTADSKAEKIQPWVKLVCSPTKMVFLSVW